MKNQKIILLCLIFAIVAACSTTNNNNNNNNQSVTLGGTVTGLTLNSSLTLQDSVGDTLIITGKGTGSDTFVFPTGVVTGTTFTVTIVGQPSGLVCTFASGTSTGTVGTVNITTVALTCVPGTATFSIGGTVTGLATNASVVLQDNGGDNLTVTGGGTGTDTFTFATMLATATNYAVTILTQPSGEICTFASGTSSGTVGTADITTVALNCVATFTVGGTVTGLPLNSSVVLQDNGGDNLTVTGGGTGTDTFTFATGLLNGATYNATVLTQPAGKTCVFAGTNNTGTINGANVTNLSLTCT